MLTAVSRNSSKLRSKGKCRSLILNLAFHHFYFKQYVEQCVEGSLTHQTVKPLKHLANKQHEHMSAKIRN